ncbi:unnamed protein product, partial [Phaedon cochleariae]
MWGILRNLKIKTVVLLMIIIVLTSIIIVFHPIQIFYGDDSSSEVPILIWWTSFMPNFDRIIKCEEEKYTCLISSDKSLNNKIAAFLFYGSHIENHEFPSPTTNALWAIFHEESPKNYAPFLYQETQDLFNITSTFSRYSDFPVTLQYLENLSLLTSRKYFLALNEKNIRLQNLSPILYVQSDCDTPIGRDYLVNELSKYIKIDSYGKCLKNKEFPKEMNEVDPLNLFDEKYMHFMAQYKFIISFENAICEDYITEKLWRPLIVGSIPIYFGSPTIEDWLPNKNSAILAKNFEDMQSLAKFIEVINQNNTLYNSFLEHKLHSRISNDFIRDNILDQHPVSEFECFVCKKIHQKDYSFGGKKKNVYDCLKPTARKNEENTWDQHWEIGKCQSKALQILRNQGKSYSQKIFQGTW